MHKIISSLSILVVIALFIITKTELVSFDKSDSLNDILIVSAVILMIAVIFTKKKRKNKFLILEKGGFCYSFFVPKIVRKVVQFLVHFTVQ